MFYADSAGKMYAHWVKIPDVDDKGRHTDTLALEYQRKLAITENVVPPDPTPSVTVTYLDGTVVQADWYARRLEHSPNQPIVGRPELNKDELVVPFHRFINALQQYVQPNSNSRKLVASYARHVCLAPHPTRKDLKIHSVKIYRVVHAIPSVSNLVSDGMDPRDPENYLPYYMGEYDPLGNPMDVDKYDAKGALIKARDPFLYWLLPNLRDDHTQLKSKIKSWVAKHAGDPDWIYEFDERAQRHLLVQEMKIPNLNGR